MSLYKRNIPKPPIGITEFEILKASHKFLRDEDEPEESQALVGVSDPPNQNTSSWNDQLAAKYYSSLYREFALCDLKHYKSGNFALRWRTEDEVLSGAGETTCGNTRCEHHHHTKKKEKKKKNVPLTTLELPFGYVEHGISKSALVKVVLCGRCLKKLMWKRNKEKGMLMDEVGDERREVKSEKDEIRDRDRGKTKRKRKEEILSEEEKHHDSAHTTPPIDRLGKRRRSQE